MVSGIAGVDSTGVSADGNRFDTPRPTSLPPTRRSVGSIQGLETLEYGYIRCWTDPLIVAKARGEHLRTHFKNMREVAAVLTGTSG